MQLALYLKHATLRPLGLAALVTLLCVACSPTGKLVATHTGPIQGVSESGVLVFKGIPFAAPPVGSLRWRPPQRVSPWTGVLHAKDFKPMCMSSSPAIPGGTMEAVSEDCLYLNIWTPRKLPSHPLPVMVYVYGGGFRAGSASSLVYWGDKLVEKGVITVNLSYRGGSFGFFAHPDLSRESGYGASGNYGVLDLIAGLQWVQQNIAAFGGNPGNVTIFGQSAGSMAVGYLVASPLAKGLFQRAIGQSGADMNPVGLGLMRLTDAEDSGVRFAKKLGAQSIEDLRRLPAERVLAADAQWPMDADGSVKRGTMAVLDHHVFLRTMYDTLAEGLQNDVPILIGYNTDEGASFLTRPLPGLAFAESVKKQYGELADDIFELYPPKPEDLSASSQRRLLRDNWYGWPVWMWARLQSRTGSGKVYFYQFSHVTRFPKDSPMWGMGAAHGFELVYTFGHTDYLPNTATAEDRHMVDTLSSYWTNFATSGNPNGTGLPLWPEFTERDPRAMTLDYPVHAQKIDPMDLRRLQLQDRYIETLRH